MSKADKELNKIIESRDPGVLALQLIYQTVDQYKKDVAELQSVVYNLRQRAEDLEIENEDLKREKEDWLEEWEDEPSNSKIVGLQSGTIILVISGLIVQVFCLIALR